MRWMANCGSVCSQWFVSCNGLFNSDIYIFLYLYTLQLSYPIAVLLSYKWAMDTLLILACWSLPRDRVTWEIVKCGGGGRKGDERCEEELVIE